MVVPLPLAGQEINQGGAFLANPDERLIEINTETHLSKKINLINNLNVISVYLNKGLAWVGGVSLLLLVIVTVANAISRMIYAPFAGTTEIVGWLAALTTAFGLGFTQLQQGYVEIDALVERFPVKLQRLIKGIMLFLSMGYFALVAWQLSLYALKVNANGNLSETMGIIFYPLIFLVALGFLGLALALLVDFLKELVGEALS